MPSAEEAHGVQWLASMILAPEPVVRSLACSCLLWDFSFFSGWSWESRLELLSGLRSFGAKKRSGVSRRDKNLSKNWESYESLGQPPPALPFLSLQNMSALVGIIS